MKTLLQIKTSLFRDGQSSRLADAFVERWRIANPDGEVIVRNLTTDPVPHLTAERFGAFVTAAAERTPSQVEAVAYSDALIDELVRADAIVLGLPMYNFGIPSTLKAYFDHVARSGITFRYTEQGPEGLLAGKRVFVFAARGGVYTGTPLDTQTDYVRNFLGFLGMADVEFVYAEGLAINEERKDRAIEEAHRAAHALAL
ncbi:MAG: NAD(P)H-dependent oxidoreductase [Pseudomonadales bacterium]